MRVLLLHPGPWFSVHDVWVGWREGLTAAGANVAAFNLHDRLTFYDRAYMEVAEGTFRKAVDADQAIELAMNGVLSAAYQYWPDVVVAVSGFMVKAGMLDLLRSRGHKVVLLHTEEPYEFDREIELAAHADLNLVNDPTYLDRFKEVAPSIYMPHAYRPGFHAPGPADPEAVSDFTFVGTGFPSRVEFLEAMDLHGIDVALAGNWQMLSDTSALRGFLAHDIKQGCGNDEAVKLYRGSKVGMNLYRREIDNGGTPDGWSMGPREIEMAATGLFFLRDSRAEGNEVFPMLPTFTDAGDATDKLRWWLAHDSARRDAAAKARDAIADRTFDRHAAELLQLIER